MIGPFITFEGIDGAGKSTHIEPAAQALRKAGYKVVCTREPGGTALAEGLRDMVLHAPMDGVTETLLVFAARRDHVIQVIEPARARGEAVLCDRFSDATFAYQGFGRGQSLQWLGQLERIVHEGLQPDLTLWFDVDPRIAAERRAAARPADRPSPNGRDPRRARQLLGHLRFGSVAQSEPVRALASTDDG